MNKSPQDEILSLIKSEIEQGLQNFIGERNGTQTQYAMKYSIQRRIDDLISAGRIVVSTGTKLLVDINYNTTIEYIKKEIAQLEAKRFAVGLEEEINKLLDSAHIRLKEAEDAREELNQAGKVVANILVVGE
jgi:prefoldin subunit 5